jgi:hypothetical protein
MVSGNHDLFLDFTKNFMCIYHTTLLLHTHGVINLGVV